MKDLKYHSEYRNIHQIVLGIGHELEKERYNKRRIKELNEHVIERIKKLLDDIYFDLYCKNKK